MENKALQELILITEHDGEGFKRVVESGQWSVAIKNYQPLNDINNIDALMRHLLTDEVFILFEGGCILLTDCSADQSGTDIDCLPLEKGKVYCVNKGVWHATIVSKDVKLIIVEDRNASQENSETYHLSQEQIAAITKVIRKGRCDLDNKK